MTRDYFLGGNTNKGFFSYYHYLADADKFKKVYIIKGGPGTGKSTTMKSVAKWGVDKGLDVDYIHCSSDPDSLDGVVIPDIGIAMVDGTSPHIVDPKNAAAVEVIINMGQFWDENAIKCNKNEIIECNREISKKYTEAYNYLAAAGNLHGNCSMNSSSRDVSSIVSDILKNLPFAAKKGSGKVRKLFAEGITPDGIISYADSISCENNVILQTENPVLGSGILKELLREMCKMGYDVEAFYSPFNPEDEIRHIVVPEEKFSVLTGDTISLVSECGGKVYELDSSGISSDCLKSRILEMTLVSRAVKIISSAKKLHDKLEKYYIPNIDFKAMEIWRESLLAELECFAQEETDKHKIVEEV